jgi:hypothetical protein
MNAKLRARRRALLAQMERLRPLVRGTLTEQYFTRRRAGRTVRLGPYYKLQLWCEGRNQTRYVPADEVPRLREAIANYHRFQSLCQEFVKLSAPRSEPAVARTRDKYSSSQ